MNEERNWPNISEENQYQHKCIHCGELYIDGKETMFSCKKCHDEYAEKFKEITSEQSETIDEVVRKMTVSCRDFIKTLDKMHNPDADEEEGVVDIKVLDTPILSAISDAFYKGYLFGKHNELKVKK